MSARQPIAQSLLGLLLAFVPVGVAWGAEPDVEALLRQVREAPPADRPAALDTAAKALQGGKAITKQQQSTVVALLGEARTSTEAKGKDLQKAGWRLALSATAVEGVTIRPEDAAWLLEHVHAAWAARPNDAVAGAALATAARALYDGGSVSAALIRSADRGLKKVLMAKKDHARFLAVALALARVTSDPARALLARALPRKGLADDHVVAILTALGETGGASAAPILLEHVPGTPAVVLEAALVGLSRLDAAGLRSCGKKLLAVTMKINEEHYRVMLALSNKKKLSRKEERRKVWLAARAKAWGTDRIVDKPPMKVPAGIGMRGVIALWWKTIDALGKSIRAPTASSGARPQFMNGRPNVRGLEWFLWWRSVR